MKEKSPGDQGGEQAGMAGGDDGAEDGRDEEGAADRRAERMIETDPIGFRFAACPLSGVLEHFVLR